MKAFVQSELKIKLVLARENLLKRLESLFKGKAIEAHLFGSLARQQDDVYSDIDIWFTFSDDRYDEIRNKRFEYYKKLGDIVHLCEAPQNAPINGVHTALLIRSAGNAIVVVDIYLCPFSTAYIAEEGRRLFGIELPVGAMGYNSKKVTVDKDYRIDFFIFFIFNAIKKFARHEQNPLEGLFREYEYLCKNYNVDIEELDSREQAVETVEKVIENIQKVANDRQKEALVAIRNFAREILN